VTGEIFGMTLFGVVMAFWALVPLFDTGSAGGRRARVTAWSGFGILAGILVFTIWGYAAL
jgi:cytochrome b6